jgi:hypothetical protein
MLQWRFAHYNQTEKSLRFYTDSFVAELLRPYLDGENLEHVLLLSHLVTLDIQASYHLRLNCSTSLLDITPVSMFVGLFGIFRSA